MKSIYAAALAATALVLAYYVWKIGNSKKGIAVTMKHLFAAASVAAFANMILMLSETESVCMVAYSIFFASIDWLLYYMLRFSIEYAGYEMETYVKVNAMRLMLALDSTSMLINVVFGHAFECRQMLLDDGSIFYSMVIHPGYMVHQFISYMLLTFATICMVYKVVTAPMIYRIKYIIVLLVLVAIVVGDTIYIFTSEIIYFPIIVFSIAGILLYHYALDYAPIGFLHSTVAMMVQDMNQSIFLFDAEGKCIRINESAQKLYHLNPDDLKEQEEAFLEWAQEKSLQEYDRHVWELSQELDGKMRHLKIRFHYMEDEKQNYLGSFFSVHDRTEETENLQRQRYLATHDRLTDLYNREHFFEKGRAYLNAHPEEEILMICCDVKNFKMVNDVFGVKTGSDLLVKIADALRKVSVYGAVYGRLEDDRFALMMRQEDYSEELILSEAKKVSHIDSDITYPIHIYFGVYEIVDRSILIAAMCDRAFMAQATIKNDFQKRIAYYDDKLRRNMLREQELIQKLDDAIATGQFHIYLQPQVSSVSGNVLGAEALIRWIHPEEGMIMPGEFITTFEKNGMIPKLDLHVWEMACIQLKKWKSEGWMDLYISVNISARDFYFMDIYKTFTGLVGQYGIDPKNLKLEITETAVMQDLEQQLELIRRLRQAGFIVEMDDFGSGYSSLNMLKDICVDVLKIDMKFLGKTEDEERSKKILKMIIELSRQLGMPVITEGVETREQAEFLREMGCDMFQGYYFAKPMAVSEFEQKYM